MRLEESEKVPLLDSKTRKIQQPESGVLINVSNREANRSVGTGLPPMPPSLGTLRPYPVYPTAQHSNMTLQAPSLSYVPRYLPYSTPGVDMAASLSLQQYSAMSRQGVDATAKVLFHIPGSYYHPQVTIDNFPCYKDDNSMVRGKSMEPSSVYTAIDAHHVAVSRKERLLKVLSRENQSVTGSTDLGKPLMSGIDLEVESHSKSELHKPQNGFNDSPGKKTKSCCAMLLSQRAENGKSSTNFNDNDSSSADGLEIRPLVVPVDASNDVADHMFVNGEAPVNRDTSCSHITELGNHASSSLLCFSPKTAFKSPIKSISTSQGSTVGIYATEPISKNAPHGISPSLPMGACVDCAVANVATESKDLGLTSAETEISSISNTHSLDACDEEVSSIISTSAADLELRSHSSVRMLESSMVDRAVTKHLQANNHGSCMSDMPIDFSVTASEVSNGSHSFTSMETEKSFSHGTLPRSSLPMSDPSQLSPFVEVNDGCQSCMQLQQELNLHRAVSLKNIKILKEKIISTGELIADYHSTKKELECVQETLKVTKDKLDACYGETGALRIQLEKQIQANEPLKKANCKLERDKVNSEAKIEELKRHLENVELELRDLKKHATDTRVNNDILRKSKDDVQSALDKERKRTTKHLKALDRMKEKIKGMKEQHKSEMAELRSALSQSDQQKAKIQQLEIQNRKLTLQLRSDVENSVPASDIEVEKRGRPRKVQTTPSSSLRRNVLKKSLVGEPEKSDPAVKGSKHTERSHEKSDRSDSSSSESDDDTDVEEAASCDEEIEQEMERMLSVNRYEPSAGKALQFRIPTISSPTLSPIPPSPMPRALLNDVSLSSTENALTLPVAAALDDSDVIGAITESSEEGSASDGDSDDDSEDAHSLSMHAVTDLLPGLMEDTATQLSLETSGEPDLSVVPGGPVEGKAEFDRADSTSEGEMEVGIQEAPCDAMQATGSNEMVMDMSVMKVADSGHQNSSDHRSEPQQESHNNSSNNNMNNNNSNSNQYFERNGDYLIVSKGCCKSGTSVCTKPDLCETGEGFRPSGVITRSHSWATVSSGFRLSDEEDISCVSSSSRVQDESMCHPDSSRLEEAPDFGLRRAASREALQEVPDGAHNAAPILLAGQISPSYSCSSHLVGPEISVDFEAKQCPRAIDGEVETVSSNEGRLVESSPCIQLSLEISENKAGQRLTKLERERQIGSMSDANSTDSLDRAKEIVGDDWESEQAKSSPHMRCVKSGVAKSLRRKVPGRVRLETNVVHKALPCGDTFDGQRSNSDVFLSKVAKFFKDGAFARARLPRSRTTSESAVPVTRASSRPKEGKACPIDEQAMSAFDRDQPFRGSASESLSRRRTASESACCLPRISPARLGSPPSSLESDLVLAAQHPSRSLSSDSSPVRATSLLSSPAPHAHSLKNPTASVRDLDSERESITEDAVDQSYKSVLSSGIETTTPSSTLHATDGLTASQERERVNGRDECVGNTPFSVDASHTLCSLPTSSLAPAVSPGISSSFTSDRYPPSDSVDDCGSSSRFKDAFAVKRPVPVIRAGTVRRLLSSTLPASSLPVHKAPLRKISRSKSLSPSLFSPPSPPLSPLPPSPRRPIITPVISPLPTTPVPESVSPLPPSPTVTSPPLIHASMPHKSTRNAAIVVPKAIGPKCMQALKALEFSMHVEELNNAQLRQVHAAGAGRNANRSQPPADEGLRPRLLASERRATLVTRVNDSDKSPARLRRNSSFTRVTKVSDQIVPDAHVDTRQSAAVQSDADARAQDYPNRLFGVLGEPAGTAISAAQGTSFDSVTASSSAKDDLMIAVHCETARDSSQEYSKVASMISDRDTGAAALGTSRYRRGSSAVLSAPMADRRRKVARTSVDGESAASSPRVSSHDVFEEKSSSFCLGLEQTSARPSGRRVARVAREKSARNISVADAPVDNAAVASRIKRQNQSKRSPMSSQVHHPARNESASKVPPAARAYDAPRVSIYSSEAVTNAYLRDVPASRLDCRVVVSSEACQRMVGSKCKVQDVESQPCAKRSTMVQSKVAPSPSVDVCQAKTVSTVGTELASRVALPLVETIPRTFTSLKSETASPKCCANAIAVSTLSVALGKGELSGDVASVRFDPTDPIPDLSTSSSAVASVPAGVSAPYQLREKHQTQVTFAFACLAKLCSNEQSKALTVLQLSDLRNISASRSLVAAVIKFLRACRENLLPVILKRISELDDSPAALALCTTCGKPPIRCEGSAQGVEGKTDDAFCRCLLYSGCPTIPSDARQFSDGRERLENAQAVKCEACDGLEPRRCNRHASFLDRHPVASRIDTPVVTSSELLVLDVLQSVSCMPHMRALTMELIKTLPQVVLQDGDILMCERMALARFFVALCRRTSSLDLARHFLFMICHAVDPRVSYPAVFISCYFVWPDVLARGDLLRPAGSPSGDQTEFSNIRLCPVSGTLQFLALLDATAKNDVTAMKILQILVGSTDSKHDDCARLAMACFLRLVKSESARIVDSEESGFSLSPFAFSLLKAIQLVSTRLGCEWTYNVFLGDWIWSWLVDWFSPSGADVLRADVAACLIFCAGCLLRELIRRGFRAIDDVTALLKAILAKGLVDISLPVAVSYAAAYAMMDVAPVVPDQMDIVRAWMANERKRSRQVPRQLVQQFAVLGK